MSARGNVIVPVATPVVRDIGHGLFDYVSAAAAGASTLAEAAANDSAYAYYLFDEASGNLIDQSANGYDLTASGVPVYQQTDYAGGSDAILFAALAEFTRAANGTQFMDHDGDLTIEFVIAGPLGSAADEVIASIWNNSTSTPDQAFVLRGNTDGTVVFMVRVASETGNNSAGRFNYTMATSTTSIDASHYHVMAQHDTVAGKTFMWVNGTKEGETDIGKPNDPRRSSFTENIALGNFSSGNNKYLGATVSFAAFYPSLLSASTIADHYAIFEANKA